MRAHAGGFHGSGVDHDRNGLHGSGFHGLHGSGFHGSGSTATATAKTAAET